MRDDKILQAIGNIAEDLIDRAEPVIVPPKESVDVKRRISRFAWAVPVAACLLIALVLAVPILIKQPSTVGHSGAKSKVANTENSGTSAAPVGGSADDTSTGSIASSGVLPSPSLTLDGEVESAACYTAIADWRGLPVTPYVLAEQSGETSTDRRIVYRTLEDLAASADAFLLVPSVYKTAQEDGQRQTSMVEYAEAIGGKLHTRQWNDYTVSTGSRVLVRQWLISGCTMDEPNNLLREGGVYLLPVKFNPDGGAYAVVGDLDVLFELNDEGKIVSHSTWEGFNQYDGKLLSELIADVHALYPVVDAVFMEQPVNTAEQAINQVTTAYNASGFRNFSIVYDSETTLRGAAVYLFKVSFDDTYSEYAAIAKENGAFIRGNLNVDGDMQVLGGLGSFPW